MFKNTIKTLLLSVTASLVLFSSGASVGAATQTLKVGVYDNPPKIYLDNTGQAKGVFADVVNAIGAKEDWNIQWVHGSWDECLQRLKGGKIDMMVDVAENADRKKIYDFNDETVLIAWGQVYARKNLSVEAMTDLDGKTMAVMESGVLYNGAGGIKPTADSFGLKIKYVDVEDYASVFKMLNDGTADVGVVNNIYGLDQADKYDIKATNIIFQPSELHFAFTKGNSRNAYLIKRIDADLRAMKADQTSEYYKSLKTNLKGLVSEVSVVPRWVTILLWAGPITVGVALFAALMYFLIQKRYQKALKRAIAIKSNELIDTEAKYKRLFDSSVDALMICNLDGFLDCNEAALEMFKIPTVAEFATKNPADMSPPKQANGEDSRELSLQRMRRALDGEPQHFEWIHLRTDGSTFDADVTLSPVNIGGKGVLQAVVRDTSQQKLAEAKVRELNILRNEFIRVVSHQLRTPLNTVNWNLETMISGEMGTLTNVQKEFLRSTHDAEASVIARLGDLLTVIDIEEGRIATIKENVSLESLFNSVSSTWDKKFQTKNIATKYIPPAAPLPPVGVDTNKIRNVFDYLLSNAFDYTPENGTVTAKLALSDKTVRFELMDSGVGIPQAEQPRIFTKFFRATNASTMATDRSGICLAICKYYVEQEGGRIGFVSQEGSGSTFWFELPTGQAGK